MSNRALLILSFITLVIIIAAVVSNQGRAPQTVIETSLLFPDLKDKINTVAAISIESAAGRLNISKQGDDWQIVESDNYPARFDKIKQTVLTVADMKVLASKTSNPALFSELGVEETSAENSGSRLLTLKDPSGNTLSSIIVGNPAPSNAAGGEGVYVRKPGANETWLVRGSLAITTDSADWLEQGLLDISDDRIMDTRIEHPDGTSLAVTRQKGETDFTITDVPEEKEPRSAYFINQVGTILSNLTIENAKARAGFNFPDTATRTTIRTYDGLVASITTANIDGLNHITVDFSVDESLLSETPTAQAAGQQETAVDGPGPDAATTTTDVRKEVTELQGKVANWVYIIPSSKYGLLVTRSDDVLQDKTVTPAPADTPLE
jgi:hypothetical protein